MILPSTLADVSLFSSLPAERLAYFAAVAGDVRLKPGGWLAREGEQPVFAVVLAGSCSLRKHVAGREWEIHRLGPGDFFGEVNLLLGIPAVSSVVAISASRVATFRLQHLKELMQEPGPCGERITETIRERLSKGPEHALAMTRCRVRAIGPDGEPAVDRALAFLRANRIGFERSYGDARPSAGGVPKLVIEGRELCLPATEREMAEVLGLSVVPRADRYDLVVVGGGPAGLAAAIYGASEGLRVLVVDQKAMGGQAGTSSKIENYLGFPAGVSGDDLANRAVRQAAKFGADMVITRRVTGLKRQRGDEYTVQLDGGESISAKTVLLSMGVRWRMLDAPGVTELLGRGVHYGVGGVDPASLAGKRVVIVGGGNSAGQAAVAFAEYARTVTVLVRRGSIAETMSEYLIEQLRERRHVRVQLNTTLVGANGAETLRVICVRRGGEAPRRMKADALFLLIGADASTEWLPRDLQRDRQGYVCTGAEAARGKRRSPLPLQTTWPGVFCAGDARSGSIKRVATAAGEGSMAITSIHQYLAWSRSRISVSDKVPTSTYFKEIS